jgi:hypothetical protein
MPMSDPYRAVADALVDALEAARGDAAEEEAALRAAIEGYTEIAEEADAGELGLTEYFAEGRAESPPALQRVPGASEADVFRWRELLGELTEED